MTIRIFARVNRGTDSVEYMLDTDGGTLLTPEEFPPAGEVILLVPIEDVLTVPVTIPSRQARKIRQALPYMLEELLFAPLESVHIAILGRTEPNTVHVAAVAHERMRAWAGLFKDMGLTLRAMLPDALLLPLPGTRLAMHVDTSADRVLVRLGPAQGFGCAPAALANFLKASGAESRELEECSGSLLSLAREEYGRDAAGYERMNLLQGAYSVNGKKQGLREWLVPLAIAVSLVLVAQVGFNLISGYVLGERARELQREATALYQELFPADTRIVNIRTQMQGHLAAQAPAPSSRASFQHLLVEIAGGLTEGMEIQRLRYDANSGQLDVDVKAANYAEFDAMQKALDGRGLELKISSASQEGDGILGRLNISARG